MAKVIFLHLSVIHSVHRGGLPQCMLGYHHHPPTRYQSPWTRSPPPGSRHPPRGDPPAADPPEETPPPEQTPPGGDPPLEQTPPRKQTLPPGKQTPAYGLRAAGTHPTGIHSCILNQFLCLAFRIASCKNHSQKS